MSWLQTDEFFWKIKEMSSLVNEGQFLGENVKRNKLQFLRMVSQEMNIISELWEQIDS